MRTSDFSDDAIMIWCCYFRGARDTLRFGGEGAKMRITDRAREALTQLLDHRVAIPITPDCIWPGREHYQSAGVNNEILTEAQRRFPEDFLKRVESREFLIFEMNS